MFKFTTWFAYDGLTGRLVTVVEPTADEEAVTFLPDGFAEVRDRRGQVFKLAKPVVVEETTTCGNGGYTAVTAHWYGDDGWKSSRHLADDESAEYHVLAVGFALRWDTDRGEHRVLARFGEHPVRRSLICALTSKFLRHY